MNFTGFDAYRTYHALVLHFRDPKFDYFKYHGKIAAKLSSYRESKTFHTFQKLADKNPDRDQFVELVLSNILANGKIGWPGDLLEDDAKEIYTKWKGRIESFTYNLNEDCNQILSLLESKNKGFNDLFLVPKGSYAPIILLYTKNYISLETLVVLEDLLSYCKSINKELKGDFIWSDLSLKITKYKPFLTPVYDKTNIRTLLKDKFVCTTKIRTTAI